jgi:hypothetical protein
VRSGEQEPGRQKRQQPREQVRARQLGQRDEGLLQEIEEGRPGVVAEQEEELTGRLARRPEGEELIFPEGARREQEPARENRRGDGEQDGCRGEPRKAWSSRGDPLC